LRQVSAARQQIDRLAIAEDDELTRVFNHSEPTAMNFLKKPVSSDQTFNIDHLSPHGPAFSGASGRKEMRDPAIW
jgi:hypothetical protein